MSVLIHRNTRPDIKFIIMLGFFVFLPHILFAQQLPVIPHIDKQVILDGNIQEPAWDDAINVNLVQQLPDFDTPSTEESEVFLAYTDKYFYVACKCYDGKTPTSASFKRDYGAGDSDWFQIMIDTFNDNENMLLFGTTPTGLRTDFTVSNDAEGSNAMDKGWNTFWDVEVTQNESGYFVEMRIPLSSLRFQEQKGMVTMGIIISRSFARNAARDIYPAIPPNWRLSHLKASQAQDFLLEKVQSINPLRITPYGLSGLSQQQIKQNDGSYEMESESTFDAGLDMKYGLTSNLTLDLTVNTDFAQVEADNQQVNLTRFPLFFPEKRNFFLERASNFNFDFGGVSQLFYSRRIGIHNDHRVPILGGARLVGRVNSWDIGFLNMQTGQENLGNGIKSPSENFGVLRLRRRVINPYSYIGGITTSRFGADGTYNFTYGVDGVFQLFGSNYLSAKWAQTFDDSIDNLGFMNPSRFQVQWNKRSNDGFLYDLQYDYSGKNYNPGIGFELREDYFKIGNKVGYGWFPNSESIIQSHQIYANGEVFFRNLDRSLESLSVGPEWSILSNSGHSITLNAKYRIEDLRQSFQLGNNIEIHEETYSFSTTSLRYSMPMGWPLRTSISFQSGGFFDGYQNAFQIKPSWNISRFLNIGGAYEYNHINFEDKRQSVFDSHIARLKLDITPNVKMSILSFVQYNSVTKNVAANIRFRYNWRQGNDLYLVLNENLNTDRHRLSQSLPLQQSQTLLLKYTYTFNFDR